MENPIVSACKAAVYRAGVCAGIEDWQNMKLMKAMSGVHDKMSDYMVPVRQMYFDESVDLVLARLREIMLKKQADYGPRNIMDCGQPGVVIRANDKMARLKNLYGISDGTFQMKTASNESIEDSFIDLANYAIIALMLRANQFDLPLKKDAPYKPQTLSVSAEIKYEAYRPQWAPAPPYGYPSCGVEECSSPACSEKSGCGRPSPMEAK